MRLFASKSRLGLLMCLGSVVSIVAPNARAAEQQDPPTRVARISYVDGSVSLQPGGEGDWGSAARNRPVTIGDKLWVDKDSRAELQAGQAAIHLGSMTALSFLNLDQGITQMRLAEGSINFRVSELREGDLYEVDAPNLAFTVKQAGAFRIDVAETGDGARVTVIRGEGEVTAGGKTYEVHAGERGEFNGTDNIEYSINRAPSPDGLDRWASERDRKEDNSVSARYVSRDMVGYDDLDDYGTWRDEPEYGHVWYPREVAVGWAPYSSGYWNWVGPWGWTWVDYSPWGFAPFHYGRWSYIGGAWGWCPGPVFGPPIYGPAFVGFFGGGFGVQVGWFPLGYGEPFFPWFGCRHEFIERINVNNTYIRNTNVFNANIRNINYVNAHNVNAVSVANRNAFVNGQAIDRGAVRVTAAALRGAQVTNSVGIQPTPRSSLGSVNSRSQVATPPADVQNRTVVARTAPAQGASQMPVRTVNSTGLTSGRKGDSQANGPTNRPANGDMNQRAGTPNAPAHSASAQNTPTVNGRATTMPNSSPPPLRQNVPGQNVPSQNRPPSAMPNSSTPPLRQNVPGQSVPSQNRPPSAMPNSSAPPSRQNVPSENVPSQNRPPSAMPNSSRTPNAAAGNPASQRSGSSPRTWEAQGNATDRGSAPAGFGSSNRPANPTTQIAPMNDMNRAPSDSRSGALSGQVSRSSTPSYSNDRPTPSSNGRSYEPPQRGYGNTPTYDNRGSGNNGRSYEAPPRTNGNTPSYDNRGSAQPRSYNPPPTRSYSPPQSYSAPSHSYSAPSRSYSAPSPSYSAPSRSYSAPSPSSSGGGGGNRGGNGGGGGGRSSRGGGGSGPH
jgi:hypothetical protein